jgi:hypothetical protein
VRLLLRLNGCFLLFTCILAAYLRFQEPGPLYKLVFHSLLFVAFGLTFAASPSWIIRLQGYQLAMLLRSIAFLVVLGLAAFDGFASVTPLGFALLASLLLSVFELIYTRRVPYRAAPTWRRG